MIIHIEIQNAEELDNLLKSLKIHNLKNISLTRLPGLDMHIEKGNKKSGMKKLAGIWKDYDITSDKLRDKAWKRQ